jgi:hypothetical protein
MVAATLISAALLRTPGSVARGALSGIAIGLLSYCYSPGKVAFVGLPAVLCAALVLSPPRGVTGLARARGLAACLLGCALVGLPHLLDLFGPARGLSRYRTVHGGFEPQHVLRGLANNMNSDFLFFSGDPNPAHHFGVGGMLNPWFLPWLAVGIAVGIRAAGRDVLARFVLLLAPLGFLPAAIAASTPPHALRSLLASVPLAILAYSGWRRSQAVLLDAPRRRALGALVLAGWAGFGVTRAVQGLRVFYGPYSQRNLGGFTSPRPRWSSDREKPEAKEHGVDTLAERYYRAVVRGDLGYCQGAAP